jgi:hypothetical protein
MNHPVPPQWELTCVFTCPTCHRNVEEVRPVELRDVWDPDDVTSDGKLRLHGPVECEACVMARPPVSAYQAALESLPPQRRAELLWGAWPTATPSPRAVLTELVAALDEADPGHDRVDAALKAAKKWLRQ